jgi:SAM-dependent methyltransferase
MSDIHPDAAVGFGRAAGPYERGRPGYPSDALAWLAERLELGPGRTVLDLAAGTGALTRALLTTGAEVVAVEPVAEMRSALPDEARVLSGTAEAIPLGDATADAVTVAQAFHWFDGPVALAEIHRVLRSGGALALVWNRRDQASPVNRAIDALLAPYRRDTPSHATDAWRAAFAGCTDLFGPFEEERFANHQTLDARGMADRIGSISFVAALPAGERAEVLAAARALAASGPVTIPYRTEVGVCVRR